jgi:hypothetical protein
MGEREQRIEEDRMQRIRIERKVLPRGDRDRYASLPLDPRDPDILRAKQLLRREHGGRATPGSGIASVRTA